MEGCVEDNTSLWPLRRCTSWVDAAEPQCARLVGFLALNNADYTDETDLTDRSAAEAVNGAFASCCLVKDNNVLLLLTTDPMVSPMNTATLAPPLSDPSNPSHPS